MHMIWKKMSGIKLFLRPVQLPHRDILMPPLFINILCLYSVDMMVPIEAISTSLIFSQIAGH